MKENYVNNDLDAIGQRISNPYYKKRVMIMGEGISGQGAYKALSQCGASCFFYSQECDLDREIDLVVTSPGIASDNEVLIGLRQRTIPVIGEIELGSTLCTAPIIAITGTNGKTTITELIGKILKCGGFTPLVCGNIGVAFSAATQNEQYDVAVVEVSSFQLESINAFRPQVAVISSIAEDHLDRHKTMESYIQAKLRITKNQTDKDYLILPRGLGCRLKDNLLDCKARLILTEDQLSTSQSLYYEGECIVDVSKLSLLGNHNLINCMLAIAATKCFGVATSAISEALRSYTPSAYRMAFCGEHLGTRYYNDSKGTNIEACLCACNALNGKTCLIVGGSDKGYSFDPLFLQLPKNIVRIYAVGQTAPKILDAAARNGYKNIEGVGSIREAAFLASSQGFANILLSPAAASFDSYSSYQQRGQEFDRIVWQIIKSSSIYTG